MREPPEILPRYGPQRAFPLAAYRPGHMPHRATLPEPRWDLDPWDGSELRLLENREFRWGVDLFNHHYFWEAHEVWEGLWKGADPDSSARHFLQGLIQCAGAALKASLGQARGCVRLRDKGLARLAQVRCERLCLGANLQRFVRSFQNFPTDLTTNTAPPTIILAAIEE